MESGKYYVVGYGNNFFEGMTKEQIIAAIAEATGETPTDIDAAFITKIKETNRNKPIKVWFGSQAEYNALQEVDPNTFYVFTDTDEYDEIINAAEEAAEAVVHDVAADVAELQRDVDALPTTLSGTTDPSSSLGDDGDIYFKYEA